MFESICLPGDKRFVTLLKANVELQAILLLTDSLLKVEVLCLLKFLIVCESLKTLASLYCSPSSLAVVHSSLIYLAYTLLLLKSLNC